nr:hypothetical protein [uncultured Dethiosulfovibrio sp.]
MTAVKRTLRLPARGGVPIPSSQLLGDEADRRKKTALGQGARLSPHMAQSLEKKELQGFSLSSSEALHFLKEEASALQASGFTLQLPSCWTFSTSSPWGERR